MKQMKRLMWLLLMAVIVFAAASAGAETYTVKKGDCLSRIAVRHHVKVKALHQANQAIKNPDLIYPGQILTIPTTEAKQEQVVETEFTPLNDLGRHAFGPKRDGIKAIRMSSLPEEVKQILIAKVQKGEFEWASIKKGNRFREMFFGDYKIAKNKIANWDSSLLEAARLYQAEFEGVVYSLYDPLKCRNWAWWAEKKKEVEKAIKPPAAKPPEVIATPLPEPEKKKMMLVMIPVDEQSPAVKAEIPPPVIKTPAEKASYYEHETFMWYGSYWALKGDGKSAYVGGKHNSFFAKQVTGAGTFREGAGVTANAWQGLNDGFLFRGDRFSIGPVVDLTSKNGTRTVATVQAGKQRDFGHDGNGYSARQDTDIILVGLSNDVYKVGPFNKIESWGDFVIDVGRSKESNWQGSPIPQVNDPAEDKTGVAVGSRLYFWQMGGAKGGVVGKGTYAFGDHGIGVEAGPFMATDDDMIKVGAGWRYQFNSSYENNNGHLVGLGADIDLEKLFSMVSAYVRSKTEKEKTKQEVTQ